MFVALDILVGMGLSAHPAIHHLTTPQLEPTTLRSHQDVELLFQNLITRSLIRNRQMLAMSQRAREQVEQWQRDADPRFDPRMLAQFREQEELFRARITRLERGRLPD